MDQRAMNPPLIDARGRFMCGSYTLLGPIGPEVFDRLRSELRQCGTLHQVAVMAATRTEPSPALAH